MGLTGSMDRVITKMKKAKVFIRTRQDYNLFPDFGYKESRSKIFLGLNIIF